MTAAPFIHLMNCGVSHTEALSSLLVPQRRLHSALQRRIAFTLLVSVDMQKSAGQCEATENLGAHGLCRLKSSLRDFQFRRTGGKKVPDNDPTHSRQLPDLNVRSLLETQSAWERVPPSSSSSESQLVKC